MKGRQIQLNDDVEIRDSAEIRLSGKLDAESCQQLTEALNWVLAESGHRVILDLSKMNFITLDGLTFLIKTKKDLAKINVKLFVTKLQPQVRNVFRIFYELRRTALFSSRAEMEDYLAAMQFQEA